MEIVENLAQWQETFESGWLAHFKETGETNFKLYPTMKNTRQPAGPAINLSQSRLALISSAGGYLRDSQPPFDGPNPLGDYSIRRFPVTTPFSDIAYEHTHYDHTAVNTDPQVLLPLLHLAEMVEQGAIGELSPSVISFMGYQPDVPQVLAQTIPAILEAAKAEQIDAALLVPS